jgi:hypothetical protein
VRLEGPRGGNFSGGAAEISVAVQFEGKSSEYKLQLVQSVSKLKPVL